MSTRGRGDALLPCHQCCIMLTHRSIGLWVRLCTIKSLKTLCGCPRCLDSPVLTLQQPLNYHDGERVVINLRETAVSVNTLTWTRCVRTLTGARRQHSPRECEGQQHALRLQRQHDPLLSFPPESVEVEALHGRLATAWVPPTCARCEHSMSPSEMALRFYLPPHVHVHFWEA